MKQDEQILVVKRELLFEAQVTHGMVPMNSFDDYVKKIDEHKEFLWRSKMEEDPAYKQIIPYMIFSHAGKYFLMRRRHDGNAKELRNKYTLGIGGHLRQEDMGEGFTVAEWGAREFEEEVRYEGAYSLEPLGLLNDEASLIGRVHAGFAFILHAESDQVSIRSEFKEGFMLSLDECMKYYDSMELWSQFVIDYLIAKQATRGVTHEATL